MSKRDRSFVKQPHCKTFLKSQNFPRYHQLLYFFEKEKSLGGILKDVKKDENIFFNSCQYFNPEEKWYKTHIEGNLDFKIFNHRKGSFTDIFDNQIFELNVPNPTCEKL